MDIKTKRRVLEYLENHDDGSFCATELINAMRDECNHADTHAHSVSIDDLKNFHDQEMLKRKLGKSMDEPYTVEDCETVCDAIGEWISEDFCEDLGNAIEYEL